MFFLAPRSKYLVIRIQNNRLVHTADADETKMSCLVRVGGVNTIGDQTQLSLSCLQLCSHRQRDKTRQFCRVSKLCSHRRRGQNNTKMSCFVRVDGANATADKTRQDSLPRLAGGVHKLLVANWKWVETHRNWVETRLNYLVGGVNKPLVYRRGNNYIFTKLTQLKKFST